MRSVLFMLNESFCFNKVNSILGIDISKTLSSTAALRSDLSIRKCTGNV